MGKGDVTSGSQYRAASVFCDDNRPLARGLLRLLTAAAVTAGDDRATFHAASETIESGNLHFDPYA